MARISSFKNALATLFDSSQATGDLIYFDGTKWTRLPKGTDNYVLSLSASLPVWVQNIPSALSFSGQASGDIIYYNGSAWVVLHKAADNTVLTLASGLPSWVSPAVFSAQSNVQVAGITDTLEHFLIMGWA